MASSAHHNIDSCAQCDDDFDLGIVVRRLTEENALCNVQGRVTALCATLLDQGTNTVRALRNAFLAKVRLCEAERAISRALAPHCIGQHSSKQERDAARGMAAQLKLRVEVLRLFQGDGSGKMLKSTYKGLENALEVLSSELTGLAERHRTLLAMLSCRNKAVLQERVYTPDVKLQLESRWMHVSSTVDSQHDKMKNCKSVLCVTSSELVLFTESQARSDALRQLCLEIQQTGSLL
ncbi:uncharacterized protein LOC117647275 isoform X2 [Thrips palmi]|uniref:Uncharacterized protein LOC117647275 isoform X2 n=1 Tax=Thrips palmi TaxID=161013 RepID=A0A6P8ZPX6_THRPL|nr:uncharacterized protein LOC117647275 isoform X2 [Thrips palmi]